VKPSRSGIARLRVLSVGAVDLDFVQVVLLERVGDEGATRLCDDALPLHSGIDPVANLDLVILPVEVRIANGADETALVPDARLYHSLIGELHQHVPHIYTHILERALISGPGLPFPYMSPVALDEREIFLGVARFVQPELRLVVNRDA
jgi:hypothetical protein